MRAVAIMLTLLATTLTLAGCSETAENGSSEQRRRARAQPDNPYDQRTLLSHYSNPYPATNQEPTFALTQGVASRKLQAISRAGKRELNQLINTLAISEGMEPALVHAVISQESAYNPSAYSHAGAAGLMQLMPGTAADYGLTPGERFDPVKNIRAGIRHLKMLQRMFPGNLDLVLAAYNSGQGTVIKYGRTIPPYKETQEYVGKVKGYLARYRQSRRHQQSRGLMAESQRRSKVQRSRSRQNTAEQAPGVMF